MGGGKFRLRGAAFIIIMIGFSIAMWGGCSDAKLWWYGGAQPQTITAQELAENGPGNNVHVLVTDYTLSAEGYGNGKSGYLLLVFPNSGDSSDRGSLVLHTSGDNSLFGEFIPEGGLQGIVRNVSDGFNSTQRTNLKKLGPIKFEKVWMIEHLRKPPPWWSCLLKILGGLALVVGGGAMFWAIGTDD